MFRRTQKNHPVTVILRKRKNNTHNDNNGNNNNNNPGLIIIRNTPFLVCLVRMGFLAWCSEGQHHLAGFCPYGCILYYTITIRLLYYAILY